MKIHTNKAAIVSLVYDAMLIGLAISLFIGLDLNRYWFIHTTVIVFALLIIYIINKEPVFILEKSDRLVFQYLIRRRTIMFSDIKSYTYPIRLKRQRNVAVHRIYLNTDEEIILHDTFTGLARFAAQWTQDKNDSNQSEVSSQYIHNGMAFSFAPHLLQQQAFYGMCVVLVAGIICIVRIVMNYSAPLPYFILALTPVWIYVLGMPFSSFNVADDTLTIRNRFVKAYNHNIYLDNVKWISMAGSSFHVMMKDGTSIKVFYNLSTSQKMAFTKQLNEIGIICI